MPLPQSIESPRFELLRGWTYNIEPMFDVDIAPQGRYGELVNLSTRYPRIRFDVTIPEDKQADIPLIYRWYMVVRKSAIPFRVRNPTDYLSTVDGFHVENELLQPTALDQPLRVIEGTEPTYQLFKQYLIGDDFTIEHAMERPIFKPVAGTILVANELGELQPANRWQLDTSTGILTPELTFEGTPTTWGGEFDTPVRFDSTLPLRMQDWRVNTSFVLVEKPLVSPV